MKEVLTGIVIAGAAIIAITWFLAPLIDDLEEKLRARKRAK